MFRLSNTTCFLELDLLQEEVISGNSYNSILFRIAAQSRGFCGQAETWVFAENLEKFCNSLIALNNTLKGEALLESEFQNEFSVKIASVNSRGYLGVSGTFGHHFFSENSNYWHSVSFGFEFEPAQLQRAVQMPWVNKYAVA
jgi:hypothetical protein